MNIKSIIKDFENKVTCGVIFDEEKNDITLTFFQWLQSLYEEASHEGRDFFKKELLLDIKSNEKRGWEIEMILDSVKNLLK